jgi:type II restriction enzyme
MRKKTIELIFNIAKEKNAFDILEKQISKTTRKQLSKNIIECGILPEMFEHDSLEEKLWAKFSDIILSQSLNHLGIKSEVLGARGNSADVYGKTSKYTIVGDAKTFRLSRSAKNQKDFKVGALDSWRQGNNYAMLVAPLTQYPNRASQIYSQAIDKNVTLLSYTHLHFLLDFHNSQNLQTIWETCNVLKKK